MKRVRAAEWCVALLSSVGGCSSSSSSSSSRPVVKPASNTVPDAAAPAASRPRSDARVLLAARGDLVGDATLEKAILYRDGALVAGSLHGTVAMSEASDYWIDKQAELRVVELDRTSRLRAVLVALPIAEQEEDPPNRYQLFVPSNGALRRILDLTPGAYGPTTLKLAGDGTVRYLEDGWRACERGGYDGTVAREEVVLGLQKDGLMAPTARKPTSEMQDCRQLAACPFVYVVDEQGAAELVGEILRHLRGARSYAGQTLLLPTPTSTALRVRLAETKPEVTHLDQIFVELDGTRAARGA